MQFNATQARSLSPSLKCQPSLRPTPSPQGVAGLSRIAASFGRGWGNRRLTSLNLSIIANYADVVTL